MWITAGKTNPTDGKAKTAAAEQKLFNFSLLFQSVWESGTGR